MALTGARAALAMMLKSGSEQQAFTLLEVMLVLVVLGLAAALVAPNISGMDSRSFNAQVREAHALLNHARRTAVVRGIPMQAEFIKSPDLVQDNDQADPARAAPGRAGSWQAGDISLAFRDSNNQRRDVDYRVDVVFFPEGGSTGGELIMRRANSVAVVSIDPFSGRVRTRYEDD